MSAARQSGTTPQSLSGPVLQLRSIKLNANHEESATIAPTPLRRRFLVTLTLLVPLIAQAAVEQPALIAEFGRPGNAPRRFDACDTGTVSYQIESTGSYGIVPIQRIVSDNASLCEALRE